MMAWLRALVAGELFRSVLIGALAWLIGKGWDLQSQRWKLYGDVAVVLAGNDAAARHAELTRLLVVAPTPVALAAQRLDGLGPDDPGKAAAERVLLIAMRRDTALWAWIDPRRWSRLDSEDITP